MAGRRKPQIERSEVSVEAVVWTDAQMKMRERLSTDLLRLMTVGVVVYEDAQTVVLASEIEHKTTFMQEDMDYTKIPVPLIVSRTVLGTVRLDGDDSPEAA